MRDWFKRVLITGATGSGARYLIEYLQQNQPHIEIHGTARRKNSKKAPEGVTLHEVDLLDTGSIFECLKKCWPDVIFHLAANPDKGFEIPSAILMNNAVGTCNLFEAIRIVFGGLDLLPIRPTVINVSCYCEDTEILTRKGFIKFDQLTTNDLVASMVRPGIIRYVKPKRIISQLYTGNMYHIKTRNINLLITPEHRMVRESIDRTRIDYPRIDSLPQTNPCYFTRARYRGETHETTTIDGKSYKTSDLLYLLGLYIGDGYRGETVQERPTITGMGRQEWLNSARDTNGRFTKLKGFAAGVTVCRSTRIFLAIPRRDKARRPAIKCLKRLGLKFSEYKDTLYFSSRPLLKFLKQCGETALTKRIPEWVFDYDADHLDFLYKGMIDSDGSYSKHERCYYSTSSPGLADDFMRLCVMTGRNVTYTVRYYDGDTKVTFKDGHSTSPKPNYMLVVGKCRRGFIPKDHITIRPYSGRVWCVETEPGHNVIVRRDKRVSICGNSSEVYGAVRPSDIPINEDCPKRPVSPYAVSKLAQDCLGKVYFDAYGMQIITTRSFTYNNFYRTNLFTSDFARQIALIELEKLAKLKHGNLESVRVMCDARDIARAYWLCATKCTPGEAYNIGGGQQTTVRNVLYKLCEMAMAFIPHEEDPSLLRPVDVTLQVPDCTKFKQATGWEPQFDLDASLRDLLNHWRKEVRK